jgi:hypothetical protein
VAARAGRDQDQAVGALLDRLVREELIDDVVQHDASVGMHRPIDVLARAERRDHDRHAIFHANVEVVIESVVRLVHDLVDRKGSRRPFGMFFVVRLEFGRDALQPFGEDQGRPRVERRKRADYPGLALGDDEVRPGDDEHRRSDHRQSQPFAQHIRHGHGKLPSSGSQFQSATVESSR